jgi:hypothetical protein
MRKLTYMLTIFIGLISACNSSGNKTNKEFEYLKVRNSYVQYFEKFYENNSNPDWTKIDKQDNDSLLVLEKMLREILKDADIDSIGKYGKINLETLTPELGFGRLDGLVLNKYSSPQIFVTSKTLFFDYFKSQHINSIQNLTSKQLSDIFSSLISEAGATVLYSEKMYSNKNSEVYGSIGTIDQGIGTFLPDNIFVLVVKGNYVYIIQKYLDKPINEMSKCQAIYDSMYINTQKYYDRYIASNLTDETAFNKKVELEETAWNKYCECYQENFKSDEQYDSVLKQIENIVQYVEQ